MNIIDEMARDQLDKIDCQKNQKILNAQISILKDYLKRYKPSRMDYPKSQEGSRRFEKDFKEWDDLMRL